jgi:hypothetical protein
MPFPIISPIIFDYAPNSPHRRPFSHVITEALGSYFSPFKGNEVVVVNCGTAREPISWYKDSVKNPPRWYSTALKVVSYITVVLPILALFLNLSLRFYLNLGNIPFKYPQGRGS